MKHTTLSIFSLSALILLGNFPVKVEGITPEIKTVGQLRQETKARNLLVSVVWYLSAPLIPKIY